MKLCQTMHPLSNFIHGDLCPCLTISSSQRMMAMWLILTQCKRRFIHIFLDTILTSDLTATRMPTQMWKVKRSTIGLWLKEWVRSECYNLSEKVINADEVKEVFKLLKYFKKNDMTVKNLPQDAHFSKDTTESQAEMLWALSLISWAYRQFTSCSCSPEVKVFNFFGVALGREKLMYMLQALSLKDELATHRWRE